MPRVTPVYLQTFAPNRDDPLVDKELRATLPMTKWMEIITNNVDALAGDPIPLKKLGLKVLSLEEHISALEERITTLEAMLVP